MLKVFITALVMAGFTLVGTVSVEAHCGACGTEAKHDHDHEHAEGLKPYVEGETKCCSAKHYAEMQKKEISEQAKKEFKEGACCSADHYASKKVEAAEVEALKSEYKEGETACCSAEHYAKKKMEAEKAEE